MVLQVTDLVLVQPLCRNWGNFFHSVLPVWFGRDAI